MEQDNKFDNIFKEKKKVVGKVSEEQLISMLTHIR
jgi:hypothetical protein